MKLQRGRGALRTAYWTPGSAYPNAREASTITRLLIGRIYSDVSRNLTVLMPELKRKPACQTFYPNIFGHHRQRDLMIPLSASVTNHMPNELCRNAFVSGVGIDRYRKFCAFGGFSGRCELSDTNQSVSTIDTAGVDIIVLQSVHYQASYRFIAERAKEPKITIVRTQPKNMLDYIAHVRWHERPYPKCGRFTYVACIEHASRTICAAVKFSQWWWQVVARRYGKASSSRASQIEPGSAEHIYLVGAILV